MQEIDGIIDEQPALAARLAELDIRNQQAHAELQAYSSTGKFANQHPLVQEFNLRQKSLNEYIILKRTAPAKLMNGITSLQQNIRRVESNLRTKKYKSEDERKTWYENLQRLKIRHEILEKIISE
jgi:vacuolar-type H+-ATPase subunit I/STV1